MKVNRSLTHIINTNSLLILFVITKACLLLSESISLQFNILYFNELEAFICWGNKCGIKTDDKKMFSKRNVVTVIKLLAFFIALLSIHRHLIDEWIKWRNYWTTNVAFCCVCTYIIYNIKLIEWIEHLLPQYFFLWSKKIFAWKVKIPQL